MATELEPYMRDLLRRMRLDYLSVAILEEPEEHGADRFAHTWRNPQGPDGSITFFPPFDTAPCDLKRIVCVHESLHLIPDPLDQVASAYKCEIPERMWARAWPLITDTNEFRVDFIARIIAPHMPPWVED